VIKRSDFDLWEPREVARLLALVEGDRDHYQEMLALLPTPIVVVAAGTIAWTNRAFLRLVSLRVEDLRGKDIDQILPMAGAVRFTTIPLGEGEESMLVAESAGVVSQPAPASRAERMEALQTVAGRLAHDLNNPLMIVTGYSEEVLESLPADHPVHKAVAEIQAAAQRISAVAARFTEFARKNANPAQPVDVTQLLAGLQDRIKQAAGVPCSVELSGGPVWALTDGGQLEKVILTLASKDLESARERSRLTVSCSTEAPHACISLRDDGRSLDPAKQAGIFESGLTAKMDSPEAQSGMALARAYSLVRQWGGDIAFSSGPTGSEYRINLPLRSESRVTPPEPAPATKTPAILVVDDEAGIRGLVLKFLRREGYRVLEAASAEEALEVSRGQRVNLLLTDVMLPGMQGSELAQKMYDADGRLKVLYISGYTPDERVRQGAYPPGAGFLAKPFTLAALLEKVREALPQRLG